MALSNLGLMGMAGAMLRPGGGLGDGFLAYGQGAQQDAQTQSLLAYRQAQQRAQQVAEEEHRMKLEQARQLQQNNAALEQLILNRRKPAAAPAAPGMGGMGGELGSGTYSITPGLSDLVMPQRKPQQAAQTPPMDQELYWAMTKAGRTPEQIKGFAEAGSMGMPEAARTVEIAGPGGKPYIVQLDKQGRQIGQAMPKAYTKSMQDIGGSVLPVDPYAPGGPIAKTQSPDSIASNKLGWANNAIARDRMQWERDNPSVTPVLTDDGVFLQPNRGGPARKATDAQGRPLAGKPMTEGQATAAGYADRMFAAEDLMGSIEGGRATDKTRAARSLPMIGERAERAVMTVAQQKYKQAEDDWIRAKLRKESGAVIGPEEMEQERITYFPQPGDSDEVVQQKAEARKLANHAMARMAGKVYEPPQPMPRAPSSTSKAGSINVPTADEIRAELRRRGIR